MRVYVNNGYLLRPSQKSRKDQEEPEKNCKVQEDFHYWFCTYLIKSLTMRIYSRDIQRLRYPPWSLVTAMAHYLAATSRWLVSGSLCSRFKLDLVWPRYLGAKETVSSLPVAIQTTPAIDSTSFYFTLFESKVQVDTTTRKELSSHKHRSRKDVRRQANPSTPRRPHGHTDPSKTSRDDC